MYRVHELTGTVARLAGGSLAASCDETKGRIYRQSTGELGKAKLCKFRAGTKTDGRSCTSSVKLRILGNCPKRRYDFVYVGILNLSINSAWPVVVK